MTRRVGFIQGRLSDCVDGKIQAFPWRDWEDEFSVAASINCHLMEWTLDQSRLHQNPLMTQDGQARIRALCQRWKLSIPSLTGDCFMQEPFWKVNGALRIALQSDFLSICRASVELGIAIIVVPIVDNGSIETVEQENILVAFLLEQQSFLEDNHLQIAFESDFRPTNLARFIDRFPARTFGINYDIGNSAALGFSPTEEFSAIGDRVVNVHVKDRVLGGSSVDLKAGNADFDAVFSCLAKHEYHGNYILQTARASDGNHAEVLRGFINMTEQWLEYYGLHA